MLYQQWSYFIIATKPCQLYPVYHRNLSYLQSYRNPAVFRLVKYPLLLAVISVLTTELRTLAGLVVLCNSIETKREVERHPEVQNNFLIAGNLSRRNDLAPSSFLFERENWTLKSSKRQRPKSFRIRNEIHQWCTMDPTCNSFFPSWPIMTDRIVQPLLPPLGLSGYAGFAPKPFPDQQHEASNYQSPHSPNTEANWIESYKAQLQKSEQEGAHYRMLYEIVLDQNKSLMKEMAILQPKLGKERQGDQQKSNKEKEKETEILKLKVAKLRSDNFSLKAEGKLLKDTIADVQKEKHIDKLKRELEHLRSYNTLLKAEVNSLKTTIMEAQEEARKTRIDHGHLEFEIMKRDRKLAAVDRITDARVEAESKLNRADSMIINLQEEIERACSNYGELEQDLDASKKVVASLQQDLKNAEARTGSLQRSLDTAEMGVRVLKAGFEIKCDELELQEHLLYAVACPIRRRDINFSYRKEDQRSKEAVKGGNRAAHDPNFVADAILCYLECLTERDKDIATWIYGEPLEVHATSLEDLHRLMRRTRFVDWLNTRATIRSWMKEKKHNGKSKRAEIFRELDKQLGDLSSSIASLYSEDDEIHKAFEEDPRIEAKLAELRKIAVTQEQTRKPSHS
jgi:DNA repair exonuclease SbcCD ATPase subunit